MNVQSGITTAKVVQLHFIIEECKHNAEMFLFSVVPLPLNRDVERPHSPAQHFQRTAVRRRQGRKTTRTPLAQREEFLTVSIVHTPSIETLHVSLF